MSAGLDAVRTIALPRIESTSGAITPVEGSAEIPFDVERVFFLYDVVAGAERGGHAHRVLEQVWVAAMGSFRAVLDDGRERRSIELRQPHVGLYIPTMVWCELVDFASGTICVVLASHPYDESEYIRDYDEFRRAAGRVAGR
ncbi:MAG: FdtA/QdtA family cupin domain-containing protein [Actinomycetota bacterium]|nr:FdtA/QdtA family cupin domain-containing protein [Actinomycetota bacterium]